MRSICLFAGVIASLSLAAACTSTPGDAFLKLPVLDTANFTGADTKVNSERRPSVPSMDERAPEHDHLALIDELEKEKTALAARLAEAKLMLEKAEQTQQRAAGDEDALVADLERFESLLEQAREREHRLERQLLIARLEAVQAKQELVRAKIASIADETER